jgi:hypothetical protein
MIRGLLMTASDLPDGFWTATSHSGAKLFFDFHEKPWNKELFILNLLLFEQ